MAGAGNIDEKYTVTYTDTNFLGRGTYGDVYRGVRTDTGESVAVKRIVLQHDELQDKYLQRELMALSRINHPNVVKLFDVKRSASFLYLYMEYCEEGDLEKYLRTHALPPHIMLRFIQQSAEAVLFMHTMRPEPIIHRDLKPGNFLITVQDEEPNLKVADLGFARSTSTSGGRISGTYCGTPDFMAPEVRPDAQGYIHYDIKTDVFSLGVIYDTLITFIKGKGLLPKKGEFTLHL